MTILTRVTKAAQIPALVEACAHERIFGSRILTALRVYGIGDERVKFYVCEEDGKPVAALHLTQSILTISAVEGLCADPVEELIRADMEAHGKIRLPMGGSARVELG